MPRHSRRNKDDVTIQLYSLEFKSFKETPLKADNILRRITSLNDVEILEYTYYIVKYFDSITQSLKYYILIPLDKTLEEKVEALKEIGYVADNFLSIPVEADNELVQLLEKVDEKLVSYDDKQVHIIIVDDEIQFDSKYGHIRATKKSIPYTHPVNRFIVNNMQLARLWFEVNDFLVVQKDGRAVATRFKIVEKKPSTDRKRVIHISYSTGKHKDALKSEVIEHMFKLLLADVTSYQRMLSHNTLQTLERIVRKRINAEHQEKTLELIKKKFEKHEPMIEIERVLSGDVFIQVDVAEGTFRSNDIVPAFVINYLVKKYYDELFYDLLYDIKKQIKLTNELKMPTSSTPKKKKSSIMDKIKNIYIKEEPPEKEPEKGEEAVKNSNDDISDALLDAI